MSEYSSSGAKCDIVFNDNKLHFCTLNDLSLSLIGNFQYISMFSDIL